MNVTDALAAPLGFTVAANTALVQDSFGGADLPVVTDPSRLIDPSLDASGPLQGCYGADFYNLNWNVQNDDSVPRRVTLYGGLGTNTEPTNFAIQTSYTTIDNGFGGCTGLSILLGQYLPFLEQNLAPGLPPVGFGFTLMTIGARGYPLTLCLGAV